MNTTLPPDESIKERYHHAEVSRSFERGLTVRFYTERKGWGGEPDRICVHCAEQEAAALLHRHLLLQPCEAVTPLLPERREERYHHAEVFVSPDLRCLHFRFYHEGQGWAGPPSMTCPGRDKAETVRSLRNLLP